ncbi:MAG: tetratricopeptide repeat protein, partial [Holophagales bacterium]|nr:tetratricopeptide repeat protein [Holophagales bacterium]
VGPSMEVVAASSLAVAVPDTLEPRLREVGLRLQVPLELPTAEGSGGRIAAPQGHDLRILAWAGQAFGLRNLSVPASSVPMLGEPRFSAPGEGAAVEWVVARTAEIGGEDTAEGGEDWRGVESRPVLPIARQLEVRFDTFGPPLRSARVVLEAAEGQEIEIPIESLRGTAGSAPGSRGASGTLTLPEELGEGLYPLRLESDGAAPSLPLTVALVRPDRPAMAWPRLAELVARGPLVERGGEPVLLPDEIEARVKSLRRDLLAAMLAENPVEETAKQQRLVLEALGYQASSALDDVEDEILDDLVRALPRREGRLPLLGVVLLHMELEALYTAGREFRLARHALDASLASARRFATASRGAAAEAGAAIGLVGFLQLDRGQLDSADRLFEEALGLAPDDPTLWWGRGLGAERAGKLEQAAEALETVVEAWPAHRPSRLRLAVVYQRSGQTRAARRLLRPLIDPVPGGAGNEGEHAWLECLAYQQLVRLELATARPSDALGWADRGLARFPADPSLAFGRALALDRSGRLSEARAYLLALSSRTPVGVPNARTYFNKWPSAEREALAARLSETARARAAELRRALAEMLAEMEETSR